MSLERIVFEEYRSSELLTEHVARYQFAESYVKGKHVIDLACGSGYGSEMIIKAGANSVVGIDISPDAINYAKSHYVAENLDYRQASVELLWELPKIDVIISFETIEHVPDPEYFLREFSQSLNKNGTLLISTPVRAYGTLHDKPENPFHIREWNSEEFVELLKTYFIDIDVYYQYVYTKRRYPGSRTISRAITNLISPTQTSIVKNYTVTKTPPRIPEIFISKGYIVAVCSQAKQV